MQEQRKHRRSLNELLVRLYKNERFKALANTENLTSSGMFIQTDALLFPKNSSLVIVINDPENGKECCLGATVVHRSLKGIGVQFQHATTASSSISETYSKLIENHNLKNNVANVV